MLCDRRFQLPLRLFTWTDDEDRPSPCVGHRRVPDLIRSAASCHLCAVLATYVPNSCKLAARLKASDPDLDEHEMGDWNGPLGFFFRKMTNGARPICMTNSKFNANLNWEVYMDERKNVYVSPTPEINQIR